MPAVGIGIGLDGSTSQQRGDWRRVERGADDFPYDKPTTYGSPMSIDDTGGGYEDLAPQGPMVPKDTRHTQWDDLDEIMQAFDETVGVPFVTSNRGIDGGGQVGDTPGTAGRWANAPFDRKVSDDELERAGSRKSEAPDPWSVLERMEIDMGDGGLEPIGLELDALKQDFSRSFAASMDHAAELGAKGLFALLMDLDPEYGADVFAPDDDDDMFTIYNDWGDRMSGSDEEA